MVAEGDGNEDGDDGGIDLQLLNSHLALNILLLNLTLLLGHSASISLMNPTRILTYILVRILLSIWWLEINSTYAEQSLQMKLEKKLVVI